MIDVKKIRNDFPILSQKVNRNPLVYLDNAATTQKPKVVIDAITNYYSNYNANIHRGVHTLSQQATDAYEEARKIIQQHLQAKHLHEIIFTSGTTFGINLLASSFSKLIVAGDEIIISALEHHSNIVPWQFLCEQTGAKLRVIPINKKGELILSEYDKLLSEKTKIVAISHVSNALGTINPIKKIIKKAQQVNAVTVIDGAQATPHLQPNMQELDCDFYVFSGHKVCGPTGIGVLYGKEKWLKKIPPYQGGGEMIDTVTFKETTFAHLPHKFEAGTPNIVGGIALGTAINYMNTIGFSAILEYETELLNYATKQLKKEVPNSIIYAENVTKAAVLSFNLPAIHPYDIGTIIDKLGVAVRTGHHCTQPIMDYFNIPGTIRASFAFYNTKKEIDTFVQAVKKAQQMLE